MDKKEANKTITRFTRQLRTLAVYNPNLFTNATIYLHGFNDKLIPPGFELKSDNGSYKTYCNKDADFIITIFT